MLYPLRLPALLLCLLAACIAPVAYAQVPPVVDPAFTTEELQSIISDLSAQQTRLSAQVDSLRQELHSHRVQEDFYGNALDEQATRFSLIVGGLLALAALVTWGGFHFEIQRVRKLFRRALAAQDEKHGAAEQRMAEIEARTLRALEAVYVLLAVALKNEGNPGSAFVYTMLAAESQYEQFQRQPDLGAEALKANLEYAAAELGGLRESGQSSPGIIAHSGKVSSILKKLQTADDEQVLRLAAQIREQLTDYMTRASLATQDRGETPGAT